jgi:hypothetical protein
MIYEERSSVRRNTTTVKYPVLSFNITCLSSAKFPDKCYESVTDQCLPSARRAEGSEKKAGTCAPLLSSLLFTITKEKQNFQRLIAAKRATTQPSKDAFSRLIIITQPAPTVEF